MFENSKIQNADEFWISPQSFLSIIITLVLALLWYSHKKHSYWKTKGIPYEKPFPFLGIILDELSTPAQTDELKRYLKNGPIHGFYEGLTPVLCVGDTKCIRDILVKDFESFSKRRSLISGVEEFDNTLFTLEDEDWKRVRNVVTKISSTIELKKMLCAFNKSSQIMLQYLKTYSQDGKIVNVSKQLAAPILYAMFYTLTSKNLEDIFNPQNKLIKLTENVFGTRNWRSALPFFPKLMRLFRMSMINPQILRYVSNIISQIIEERKRTGETHDDFLQMLMDAVQELNEEEKSEYAKDNGDFRNCEIQKNAGRNIKNRISMMEMLSNSTLFILGGSQLQNVLAFASYFLATNEDIQRRAFEEIVGCLKETKGILTYEALQEMTYVDNIVSETLRMYPLAVRTDRIAVADYKLADTGISISKGDVISIPIYAIHHDPKHYPDPEKFDPNRFTMEEKSKRNAYAYIPFGAGSRSCIAQRLVPMVVKILLIHIIGCFIIKTCPQTKIPIQFPIAIFSLVHKDIFLKLEERKNCPLAV